MELKEIQPASCAKVLGLVYGTIGIVAGLIVGCIAIVGSLGGLQNESGVFGSIFGVGAIVFFPVLYGTLGAIGGLLVSALYNLIARLVGGIQVTLQ